MIYHFPLDSKERREGMGVRGATPHPSYPSLQVATFGRGALPRTLLPRIKNVSKGNSCAVKDEIISRITIRDERNKRVPRRVLPAKV